MKPVERTFAPQADTCLKYFDYKGAAIVLDEHTAEVTTGDSGSEVTTPAYVEVGGRKILKAGTPYPSNDANCKGYLLHDYDVTDGEIAGTYIFEGSVDNKILTANGIEVTTEAKAATPRVTFFD